MNDIIELEEDVVANHVDEGLPRRYVGRLHEVFPVDSVKKYRPVFFVNMLIAADLSALLVAVLVAYLIQFGAITEPTVFDYSFLYLGSLATLVGLHMSGSYRFASMHSIGKQMNSLVTGCCGTVFFFLLGAFLSGGMEGYSREWIVCSALIAFCLLTLNRIVVRNIILRAVDERLLSESIVIVGANEHAEKMIEKLQQKSSYVNIVGIFDDRTERSGPSSLMSRIVGSTDELISYVRTNRVDRVVVTLPWIATDRINSILKKLRTVPVRIDLVPNDIIWQFPGVDMETLGGVPVLTIANGRVDRQVGVVKRVEDIVLSFSLLLLTAPLLLLIACVIKLDSRGPVLFKQRRHGFNNQIFEVYKFRSMSVPDSATDKVEQATRNDARITAVGRFLRRSSLDELPQLVNVLLGQMSVVGPRPHAVQHNVEYGSIISEYFARHNVRPGITGWAQINGLRGETDTVDKMHRRVDADLYYIENWSLMLDIRIIFLTALTVWFQKNAY